MGNKYVQLAIYSHMSPVDCTFPQSSSGFPKLCSAKHGFRAVLIDLPEKTVMTGNLTPLAITNNLVICSDAVRSLLSSVCVYIQSRRLPVKLLKQTLFTAQLDTTQTGRKDVRKIIHMLVEIFSTPLGFHLYISSPQVLRGHISLMTPQ
jgi:hypothetical protein